MERVFTPSNAIVRLTHHATAFHLRVYLDLHFKVWEERYLNVGRMIFNNYRQALDIIEKQSLELSDTLDSLGIGISELEAWIEEERTYIIALPNQKKNTGKPTRHGLRRSPPPAPDHGRSTRRGSRQFPPGCAACFLHVGPDSIIYRDRVSDTKAGK